MLRGLLQQEGYQVGRLQVATLLKRLGIKARYRRPNRSKPAPGLSLAAAETGHNPSQSGLGNGHYLAAAGAWLWLAGRSRRPVQPEGPSLAAVDQVGDRAISGGAARSHGPLRQARDHQHRSGFAGYSRLHQGSDRCRSEESVLGRDQQGRQGCLAGQCFRRAALASSMRKSSCEPMTAFQTRRSVLGPCRNRT